MLDDYQLTAERTTQHGVLEKTNVRQDNSLTKGKGGIGRGCRHRQRAQTTDIVRWAIRVRRGNAARQWKENKTEAGRKERAGVDCKDSEKVGRDRGKLPTRRQGAP